MKQNKMCGGKEKERRGENPHEKERENKSSFSNLQCTTAADFS